MESGPRQEKRRIGFATATALIVANMIGTGVFTTSGLLLADLHSRWAVLVVWALGGVVAGLGAMSYAALAQRIPESGGEYLFLSRMLHPAAGYMAGWISLLAGFSAPVAAAAFGFGSYTKTWFGMAPQVTGTILLVVFAFLHAANVQGGARVQNWAVAIKVGLIVTLIAIGLFRLEAPVEASKATAPISSFAVALVWVSFSYFGWNAAVYIGGEIIDPERNLPKAIYLGTALVTVLYLGLNAVFLFSTTASELSGQLEIGRIAGKALGGPMLAEAMTGLIAIALLTAVSAMMMAGPRVYARMAEDGCMPAWLVAQKGPPSAAIAMQALLAVVMLWTASYDRLLTYIGFTLNLSTAATVYSLIRLRLREGPGIRVIGWPWSPFLFLAAILWMTIYSIVQRPAESFVGLATLALGWLVWRFIYKPKAR